MLDDMNLTPDVADGGGGFPPEENSNRTFLIAAGIIGGVLLLSLISMVAYALVYAPKRASARQTQQAQIYAQNTAVALGVTQTAQAAAFQPSMTPSPTVAPPTNTATLQPVTNTPVVIQITDTPAPVGAPTEDLTATVGALLTQAANLQQTTVPNVTSLPETGFADSVGGPGLLILTLVLIGVILLVRRLRASMTE